jgi:hypothetical protein
MTLTVFDPMFEVNSVRPSRLAITMCVTFCPVSNLQSTWFVAGS